MAKKVTVTDVFPVQDAGKLALNLDGYQEFGGSLIKLNVGQACEGTYVEKSGYDSTDAKTGVVKRVNMYVLETQGQRGKLGGVVQIDEAFDKIKIGSHVVVVRGSDTKSAGNRPVHTYKVYAK